MNEASTPDVAIAAGLVAGAGTKEATAGPRFKYTVECVGADGKVRWVEEFENLVTTAGKTDLIDKYFKGSGYTAAWYLGLAGAGTKAAGDTLASHGGWTEVTAYSGNRQAITFGTTSSGSNTATVVSFSITGTATVAGAFIASAASGTSGTLYSVGDFAASRSVLSGDTLNVTMTVSAT